MDSTFAASKPGHAAALKPVTVTIDSPVEGIPLSKSGSSLFAGREWTILDPIFNVCTRAIEVITRIGNSAEGFEYAVQFAARSIKAVKLAGCKISQAACKIRDTLTRVDDTTDALCLFERLHYMFNGDFKKDLHSGKESIAYGKLCLLGTSTIGTLLWVEDCGAINLASIAKSFASVPVFGAVASVGAMPLIYGSVVLGVGFLAYQSIKDIVAGTKGQKAVHSLLMLSNAVAEVVAKTFLITGGVSPIVHTAFGLVAAGTGMARFLHGEYAGKYLEEQKEAVSS